MSLFSEMTPGALLNMLDAEAKALRQAKSEDEFIGVSVQMQKTLAAYIADAMMELRQNEDLSLDDVQHSTNRWLMSALSEQESDARVQ